MQTTAEAADAAVDEFLAHRSVVKVKEHYSIAVCACGWEPNGERVPTWADQYREHIRYVLRPHFEHMILSAKTEVAVLG